MGYGLKLVALFTCLCLLFTAGVLLFARGFLLKRIVIDDKTSCNDSFNGRLTASRRLMDSKLGPSLPGCWMNSRYKKAVIIVIDALRYDFVYFNESLREDEALPYQNKLTVIHDALKTTPTHTRLYKFIADPPTTTMQRLKGLTTGSLPTFVDAGSNFASYEIKEDNIISKLVEHNKKITFMGDDTWLDLFPKAFNKSYPYPSFNVKDLHTVDNGVNRHLIPELRQGEWDVLIGHYLGVDHCGHTYGPYHPAMADKLTQMNKVLKSVMTDLEDDSILFVLGDHGMTKTGDHGGDSADELAAALFVYTKKPLDEAQDNKVTHTISQVDLVPTISLLLGLPVPFGNLGTVVTDLFTQSDVKPVIADFIPTDIRKEWTNKMKKIEVLQLNALQLFQYLTKYEEISEELPKERLSVLTILFTEAESLFHELQDMYLQNNNNLVKKFNLEMLSTLEEKYSGYLSGAKKLCEDLWAKFDMLSITVGVLSQVVFLIVMLAAVWNPRVFRRNISTVLCVVVLCTITGLTAFIVPQLLDDNVIAIFGCSIIVSLLALLVRFYNSIITRVRQITRTAYPKDCLTAAVLFAFVAGTFSNSYIVYEDSGVMFLVSSLAVVNVISAVYSPKSASHKPIPKTAIPGASKKQKKETKKLSIWSFLSSDVFRILVALIMFVFCGRLAASFRTCREEQVNCESSGFLQPLSALADTGVNLNERFLLSTLCICCIPLALRQWLSYQGNLNGAAPVVICVKYAIPFAVIFTCAHWALQIIPAAADELFPNIHLWQQIILPEFAYWLCLLTIALLLWQPLCIYTILRDSHSTLKNSIGSYATSNPMDSRTRQLVYREMKSKWNRGSSEEESASRDETPVVYGLGSVYSSTVIVPVVCIVLPLVLVLGDGMVGSVVLILLQMVLYLEIEAYAAGLQITQNGLQQGPSWHSVVVWSLLASQGFYSTGHQATIPAIRFEAAFVGLPGDMNSIILPGLLIVLNTFVSHILFSVSLPLLLLWPRLTSRLLTKATQTAGSSEMADKGEFALSDYPDDLREQIFRLILFYQFFNGIKVLSTACSAAIHRRHLMVWKIFAPRFVFESASFLVSIPFLIFIFLVILRIDLVLEKWTQKLAQYCTARVKLS